MLQPKEIEEKYTELVNNNAIIENTTVLSNLKFSKAENDLALADGLLKISIKKNALFGNKTFFDWVIVASYFSIFHSTQALLGLKKVKIIKRRHEATLFAFAKHFITTKELEDELFFIYENVENKAKELLDIFEEEKRKRGLFQYNRLSRENLEPAKESLNNAKKFVDTIRFILSKNNMI
ncbi:hypothetical protein HZA97_02345 [Candidatus Woesearchaeota archaeon]|nr:hypothetical protein [Candidatus Woesearchaeota archaeon]